MKRYVILLILISILLTGCFTVVPGQPQTDPNGGKTTKPTTEETRSNGWVKEAGKTYYLREDGSRHVGWLELDGKRYYLDNMGILQTGWLELNGETYYFHADGSAATGKITIDNRAHYFTHTGAKIMVANPWNMIPSDYIPNIKDIEDGYAIDKSCKEPLEEMLAACREADHGVAIVSGYRRNSTQITLYNRKVNYYLDQGLSPAEARKEAGKVVAMPGTSEHELGLAVDLVDNTYYGLDEAQENTDTQKWLMEHCWEYGFILRYPNNKSDKTGIIYEPWHYRYVGKEVAKELQKSGLCLEEYLENLS